MKYLVRYNGVEFVVDAPKQSEIEDYWDDALTVAFQAGYLDGYTSFGDAVEGFLYLCNKFEGRNVTYDDVLNDASINDEFWQHMENNGELFVNGAQIFVNTWDLDVKPVPPNTEVGFVKRGQMPRVRRYRRLGA